MPGITYPHLARGGGGGEKEWRGAGQCEKGEEGGVLSDTEMKTMSRCLEVSSLQCLVRRIVSVVLNGWTEFIWFSISCSLWTWAVAVYEGFCGRKG